MAATELHAVRDKLKHEIEELWKTLRLKLARLGHIEQETSRRTGATTTELHTVRDRLRPEIEGLWKTLRQRQAQLDHIQQAIQLEPGAAPSPLTPRRAKGRRSIASLPYAKFLLNRHEFSSPARLLDHLGVQHYFSAARPRKGDEAAREIVRWTEKNPQLASAITVVMQDGTSISLNEAVSRL